MLLKLRDEVAGCGESGIKGDLAYASGRGDQEFLRFRQTDEQQIVGESLPHTVPEETGEIAVAHITHLRHLLGKDRLHIVLMNVIEYLV